MAVMEVGYGAFGSEVEVEVTCSDKGSLAVLVGVSLAMMEAL